MKHIASTAGATFGRSAALIVGLLLVLGSEASAASSRWISGYYAAQNGVQPIADIPWSKYTHLYHFAAAPGVDGAGNGNGTVTMHYLTQAEIGQFVATGHAAGRKVLFVIKDNDGRLSAFPQSTTPAMVGTFAASIANFVNGYGYDGVDLDWEVNISIPQFVALIARLRQLMPGKLICMAGMQGDLATVAAQASADLDAVNVMCYDMDNSGSYAWHNDALFQNGDTSKMTADWRVRAITSLGVPAAKIVVGFPFYGRRWTGVTQPLQLGGRIANAVLYRDLVADPSRWQAGYQRWDSQYSADYLSVTSLNEFITYNGAGSIRATVDWVNAQGFAGVMTFTTDDEYLANQSGDARYPLSTVLKQAMDGISPPSDTTPPTVAITAPGAGATVQGTVEVSANAADDVGVARVEFSVDGVLRATDTSAPYGFSWSTVGLSGPHGVVAKAFDAAGNSASSSIGVTVATVVGRSPYGGGPAPIPGRIEAENFDDGGEGVAYHDADAANNGGGYRATAVDIRACVDAGGGWQVGWFGAGEWLEYTVNVATAGSYDIAARVASGASGATIHVSLDGADRTGAMTFANTGGWDVWRTVTRTATLGSGAHVVRVTCDAGALDLNWLGFTASAAGTGTGLTAQYFDNMDFTGANLTRTDTTVDFDWGGGSPDPSLGPDTFSARWTGEVQAVSSETCTFSVIADDGVRLWVDGQLLVDRWIGQPPTEWSGSIALTAGRRYAIRLEYFEYFGGAVARLLWSTPSRAKQVIPSSQLYPAGAGNGVVSGQWYKLVARHSGQVLDVAGGTGATADGALVIQWPDAPVVATNEQWRVDATADGSYTLTARHSGKALQVEGWSHDDGGTVDQGTLQGFTNQRWRIEDTGGGWCRVVNVNSGKVLDVAGISLAPGAQVQQWTDLGGANQRWALVPIAPSALGSREREAGDPASVMLAWSHPPSRSASRLPADAGR